MNLYLNAETKTTDLVIDFITVKLKSGESISLNWDESYVDRTPDGFTASYQRVCFDDEYADGRLEQLRGMEIACVGLYSDSARTASIRITEMEFEDNGKCLTFDNPGIAEQEAG